MAEYLNPLGSYVKGMHQGLADEMALQTSLRDNRQKDFQLNTVNPYLANDYQRKDETAALAQPYTNRLIPQRYNDQTLGFYNNRATSALNDVRLTGNTQPAIDNYLNYHNLFAQPYSAGPDGQIGTAFYNTQDPGAGPSTSPVDLNQSVMGEATKGDMFKNMQILGPQMSTQSRIEQQQRNEQMRVMARIREAEITHSPRPPAAAGTSVISGYFAAPPAAPAAPAAPGAPAGATPAAPPQAATQKPPIGEAISQVLYAGRGQTPEWRAQVQADLAQAYGVSPDQIAAMVDAGQQEMDAVAAEQAQQQQQQQQAVDNYTIPADYNALN